MTHPVAAASRLTEPPSTPIRAPRSDNQDLCVPEHHRLVAQVQANHRQASSIQNPSWILQLRSRTRAEVAAVASLYLRTYLPDHPLALPPLAGQPLTNLQLADPQLDDPQLDDPPKGQSTDSQTEDPIHWIVGGHQPEPFHPGVWYKNFLIDATAKELQSQGSRAIGLHVIIDHDLPKSLSIKIPHRPAPDSQHLVFSPCELPLQKSGSKNSTPKPWHQHRIALDRIETFVRQIEHAAESLGLPTPLARRYFEIVESLDESCDAAIALSQARHRIEAQNGLENIDIPMSRICQTEAWFDFVEHCLAHADALNKTYNDALDDYRAREQITNPGQPVAALGRFGDWIELPFWLYQSSDAGRNRMWVRSQATEWELASGARPGEFAWTIRVASLPGSLKSIIEQTAPGEICLRPRALMTTLFLRCFLADGFVHGIGGGIYDRLTDQIIQDFLRIEPPAYAIATATLHLPLPEPVRRSVEQLDALVANLSDQARRLRSSPESFLASEDPYAESLAQEHAALLAAIPPKGFKRTWHRRMVELKARIRQSIEPIFQEHQALYQATLRRANGSQGLFSREYSMLLFPQANCVERLKLLASRVRA